MSAPAPVTGIRCTICETTLKRTEDMQPVRERGRNTGHIRCMDYDRCMVRAAARRRAEIGMEELDAPI